MDDKNITQLRIAIEAAIKPCPITRYLICIPIQEYEAWLLSDPEAIKKVFGLKKTPNIKYHPETINSPKEYLGDIVERFSDGYKYYINTKHNKEISKYIDFSKVQRCSSFQPFLRFVKDNI